jgi:hypothetical protein
VSRLAAGLLLAALTALALARPAAAEPVVTAFVVDSGPYTVGDQVAVRVTLRVPEGTRVRLAPGAVAPPFELAKTPKVSARRAADGLADITVTVTMAAFATGDLTLAPLRLEYEEPSGARGVVATPPARVLVDSVLPASGELRLRDLKPQAELPRAGASPLLLQALGGSLAALGLALLTLAAVYARRRARPAPAPVVAVAPRSLEDGARERLDAAAGLFRAGDYAAGYARIASTLRAYLSERFAFPAFALTTAELASRMRDRDLDRWQARLVSGLLEQCDAVVYAGYRPAPERAERDITSAYEIVEMSRPAPPPVEAEEAVV